MCIRDSPSDSSGPGPGALTGDGPAAELAVCRVAGAVGLATPSTVAVTTARNTAPQAATHQYRRPGPAVSGCGPTPSNPGAPGESAGASSTPGPPARSLHGRAAHRGSPSGQVENVWSPP